MDEFNDMRLPIDEIIQKNHMISQFFAEHIIFWQNWKLYNLLHIEERNTYFLLRKEGQKS